MSKTIEFVEREIKNIKELLELDDVLCLRTDEDYKFWYNRLQTLEQIKCELEAWEEVKKDKGVCEKQEFRGKDCKKVIQISCKIFPEGTEQYEKLKKALEVK